MAEVDSAEKEASEVLHSLLSVERVVKSELNESGTSFTATDSVVQVQWSNAPVLFDEVQSTQNQQFQQTIAENEVIWDEDSTQVDQEDNSSGITIYARDPLTIDVEDEVLLDVEPTEAVEAKKSEEQAQSPKPKPKRRPKKKNKPENLDEELLCNGGDQKLELSAAQVKERFKRGCECQDESCFRGLNADNVYRHRLDIAELTKGEHDMYLMGVTMACLANPDTTVRQKERRRLRAQYVYQGRRVCLDAFLYLENCTHYQLKRIRKHVMTHGVMPRVHGNQGKKPHNTFSLEIYRHATEFLKQFMRQLPGESGICSSKQPIQLPWDVTRKNLHNSYMEYGQILEPGIKLMGYSTFRHFMKEQFPHVKFSKLELKNQSQQQTQVQQSSQQNAASSQQQIQTVKHTIQPIRAEQQNIQIQKCVISNEMQQVIPLVVAPNDATGTQHPQTFIVTPVPQIISNGNLTQTNATTNSFSYQLTNGYVINEQGNIVTTVANGQTPMNYTFNRI